MTVTAVRLGGRPDLPLLLLGPSLGTSATALWSDAARHLAQDFQVVAWDLPGHGSNRTPVEDPVTIASLAADVLDLVDAMVESFTPVSFHYAGDSVGGAVGLQLLLDAPHRVASATLLCTGARIGTVESWTERAELVGTSGTPAVVSASAQRWFGPGFLDREPDRGSALLHSLADARDDGYVAVCRALAAFDVRDRLGEIKVPVLAVAGAEDVATPTDGLAEIADGVADGRLVVLDGVAHLAPAEAPEVVARLIRGHAHGEPDRDDLTVGQVREQGMAVRREVLGDAHVDRATAAATDFTRDFQEFITEYAWGGVWTRPGLDRRARSIVTLTALVARGHHEELAMHVRAARTNGLSVEEIKEVLLQTAIYCGVPDANTAFRIAQQVLAELGDA
ncbi:3-oxoadipate enol-lactonase/4-carboxymuconolactone decarboxylase [Nocardioides ginsengisegetis]|uniref:3-oxoadipate enol-lactonase/4-carboxymuconolactone decarboxylase n=1 Tax=Nocardioides ginsengisegetis TaxID=661491 RepID=A0A7W3J2U1_9ACTN|nr:3-oxoadipate enol-lactonase/4-carboxymuconolactone decarboxylase [Nocardioides ginsengisegetis]